MPKQIKTIQKVLGFGPFHGATSSISSESWTEGCDSACSHEPSWISAVCRRRLEYRRAFWSKGARNYFYILGTCNRLNVAFIYFASDQVTLKTNILVNLPHILIFIAAFFDQR